MAQSVCIFQDHLGCTLRNEVKETTLEAERTSQPRTEEI